MVHVSPEPSKDKDTQALGLLCKRYSYRFKDKEVMSTILTWNGRAEWRAPAQGGFYSMKGCKMDLSSSAFRSWGTPTVSESVLSAWNTKEIELIAKDVLQKKKIKKEKIIHVTIHMSKNKFMQEENFICYFLRSQKPMFSKAINTFVVCRLTHNLKHIGVNSRWTFHNVNLTRIW